MDCKKYKLIFQIFTAVNNFKKSLFKRDNGEFEHGIV